MSKYFNVRIAITVLVVLVGFHFVSGMLFKQKIDETGEVKSEFRGRRAA